MKILISDLEKKLRKLNSYWTLSKLKETKSKIQNARKWVYDIQYHKTLQWRKFLLSEIANAKPRN